MAWDVRLTFRAKNPPPDEDTLLATLPQRGDIMWTTLLKMDLGESDEWEDAISWKVQDVQMILQARKNVALIILVPFSQKGV